MAYEFGREKASLKAQNTAFTSGTGPKKAAYICSSLRSGTEPLYPVSLLPLTEFLKIQFPQIVFSEGIFRINLQTHNKWSEKKLERSSHF